MQVMILHEDKVLRGVLAATLRSRGLGVQGFASLDDARAAARDGLLDLLVLAERVGGRLAHDLALLAEWRNPGLGTLLLSDREGEALDEIFDLLPSLREVLPPATDARTLLRRTLALARTQGEGAQPMTLRWRTLPEEDADPASDPAALPEPSPRAAAAAPLAHLAPAVLRCDGSGPDHAPPLRPALVRSSQLGPARDAAVPRAAGAPILIPAGAAPRPAPPERPGAPGAVFLRATDLRRAPVPARRLHLA